MFVTMLCFSQERVKSVFHAKEFGKIINFKTPELAKVELHVFALEVGS